MTELFLLTTNLNNRATQVSSVSREQIDIGLRKRSLFKKQLHSFEYFVMFPNVLLFKNYLRVLSWYSCSIFAIFTKFCSTILPRTRIWFYFVVLLFCKCRYRNQFGIFPTPTSLFNVQSELAFFARYAVT